MSRFAKLTSRTHRLLFGNAQERAEARWEFWLSFKHRSARFTQRNASDYIKMQKQFYELAAAADAVRPGTIDRDLVVGSWKAHDAWPEYEMYLLKHVPAEPSWVALEYGCGPGRNIRGFSHRFARIDGVDISSRNLANAMCFLKGQIPDQKLPRLYLTEGADTGDAQRGYYDFCFSTICLQHICVWQVRFAILENLFRALKPGGRISIQMGFGASEKNRTASYFTNHVTAGGTNSAYDVAIMTPDEPEQDLQRIGFTNFEYWIRPVGVPDIHPNWIFFTATKPR